MESNLVSVAAELQRASGKTCVISKENQGSARPGEIVICDFKNEFRKIAETHAEILTSIGVLGDVGKFSSELILTWKGAQLILEDLGMGEAAASLMPHTQEIYPASSFAFLSSEYLK